ncbi:hypothetical protein IWZ01DRAFT_536462 [Phyllosticta capitalensis]
MADQGNIGGAEALATTVPLPAPAPLPFNTSLKLWEDFFSTLPMAGDLATQLWMDEAEYSFKGVCALHYLLDALYYNPYSPCPESVSTYSLGRILKLKPIKGREFAVAACERVGDAWMINITVGSDNHIDCKDEMLEFRLNKSECKDQTTATKVSHAICQIAALWPRPISKLDSSAGAFDRKFIFLAALKHVDPHRMLSLDIPGVWYEAATNGAPEHYKIKTTLETESHGIVEFMINAAPEEVDLWTPVPKLAQGARLQCPPGSMIPAHIQHSVRACHRRAIEICNYAVCMVHGQVFNNVKHARAFLEELTSPFKNTHTSRRRYIGKQPLLSNTSSVSDGLARGVWNAAIVNDMTPGGLDDVELPDIIVNSADQGYWVQVSDRVRHALERGRPISEVMLIAAEAADDMNAAIADGEVAVQPCFCRRDERLRSLHCCPGCTVQTLCSSMQMREDLSWWVCQYCYRHL